MSDSNALPPLPLIDGCLFIDNSGWMESLMTCPRALQYKQLNKRISSAESAALNFGSAIHLGMEYRYRNYQSNPVDVFFQDGIAPILTEFFDQHPTPMEDWRTLNWAFELLRRYNERYGKEEFSLLKYKEPQNCHQCEGKGQGCHWCNGTGKNDMMVELPFALKLFDHKDIPVFYTGKIDLPVLLDNQLFVLDHKTTGMLGPTFFDQMKMSSQQKGYCWAFQQLTGQKVTGYIINAIRSKEPPQYVTNGTESKRGGKLTPEQWWKDSLQREKFYLKPHELEEWKDNTIAIIEEFFWNYSRGQMVKKTQWCTSFGRCPYFDVCSMEPQDRGVYLSSGLFTDNSWSPLKQATQSKQ